MKTNSLNRRSFLGQTSLLAAAAGMPELIPAHALGQNNSAAPSKKITLALIGAGVRGRELLPSFLQLPEAQVVAICDVHRNTAQRAKETVDTKYGDKGCATYGDFREVLARKDIDAVVIAVQDHWHALIVEAAAQAGKDMYCEKPFGVSVQESQAIVKAVRKHKLIFQTGTQQRSDRNFRFGCELALSGYVGKVHTVQVAALGPGYKPHWKGPYDARPTPPALNWDMWLGPAPEKPYNPGRTNWPDWYLIWDYCDGFIVNWGVHHLDIAFWGCPPLAQESCEVECKATYRNEGFTDNVLGWFGTFTYPSGLKMVFSDDLQQKRGCRFIGDKGWVHVDRGGIWAEPESLLEIKLKPDDVHLTVSADHSLNFLQAVQARRDPIAPVEAGHRASHFGMVADIAARVGKKLKWDTKAERFVGCDEANARFVRPMRAPWKLS